MPPHPKPRHPKPASPSARCARNGTPRRAILLLSSYFLGALATQYGLAQSASAPAAPTRAALPAASPVAVTGTIANAPDADQLARAASAPDENQVSLYLALHDRKDHPIASLKATDLTIDDAGHPVDSRELRISSDAQAGEHLITLIFDRLDATGSRNASRIAFKVLKDLGDHSGAIAVWAVDGRLQIVQSYTSNRRQVENAIAAATGRGRTAPAPIPVDDTSVQALKQTELVANEQHVPWGIASLVGAALAQRGLVGRKAILYFAQEFPADLNTADMLRAASQRLKDASISVYAIDMNALNSAADTGMQTAMAMAGQTASIHASVAAADHSTAPLATTMGLGPMQFRAMNDTVANLEFTGMDQTRSLLAQLADSTGGDFMSADADPRKICRELSGDLANYYTITYPTSTDRLDGRFHPVQLKAANPDIRLRSQAGYFALPRTVRSSSGPDDSASLAGGDELDRLAEAPSASDLVVRAALLRFGESAAGQHSVIALEVPINQLDLHEDPNTDLFSLHVSVAAEIKDASGKPVARFQEEFRRHGSMDSADKLRTQFLSAERPVTLPAGDYRLDAIVRDWNGDRIGKATQTIHLATTGDAERLSDLVLVRSTEEKSADAGSAAIPMGRARVVLNLSGTLPVETRTAALYFQIYPGPKDSTAGELRLELSKDGKLLATLPMKMEPAGTNQRSARVANVKLSSAGAYDLTLCLDQDGLTAKRHISLVSTGSTKPQNDDESESADPGGEPVVGDFGPPSLDLDLKPGAVRHLPARETAAVLSTATTRARAYTNTLPNFLCIEAIDRAIDHKGTGVWKRQDSILELLRYRDKTETRTVLEINGQKSKMDAADIKGARSNGEFGGILLTVFDSSAAADFKWEKSAEKNGEALQVYSYRIAQKNSQFYVTDRNGLQLRSAFHGLVFIDNDTRSVRRLIAETDPMPDKFGVKSSWMAIDYDYIAIAGHDYLLPTHGEVGLKQGKHESVSNQLRFTGYRRFGSHARMIASGPG